MPTPNGALRKAAVLIASLDSRSADALLDQMSSEQAARVRSAVFELGDISADEQNAVIDEFLRGGQTAVKQPDGIELDDSLARKIAALRDTPQAQSAQVATTNSSPSSVPETLPFRCLHDAAVDTLCRFLEREQPQTIAVVVSHLPPKRAAEVVTQLSATLRSDVLHRVAELDTMDPSVLHDLEQELESLFAAQTCIVPERSAGLAAVSAILDAMDGGERQDLLTELATRDERLAAKLHRDAPCGGSRSSEANAQDESMTIPFAAASEMDAMDDEHEPSPDVYATPAIDFDFADVERLDHRSLALLLHEADPQVALLALTGAERSFVERILKQLPAKEAKLLDKKLHRIGPLRLSDVEEAQQELATAAGQLAARGLIPLPPRKLATAA